MNSEYDLKKSSEYDLKKSKEGIGQLYPILEAKDGEIIDGIHREQADKDWKRVRLDHIDTEEKKLVARLVSNFHRRIVPYEEKKEWINGLARIYKKQGIAASTTANQISERLGIPYRTVLSYLDDEFKQISMARTKEQHAPSVPASQRIEKSLGTELVERHREEVIEEEKPKIEKELKLKLVKQPNFQRQVLEELRKPQPIASTEEAKEASEIVDEMVDEYLPAIEKAFENMEPSRIDNPERNRLVLNMLLKNLTDGVVFCPVCKEAMFECSHCHTSLAKMKEAKQL